MNATKIEYLNFTWSPNVGCSGDNCAVYKHCFAKKFKKRNLLKCQACYEFKPHNHFERLEQPLHTKLPQRIGVNFSADFWDKGFSMDDRYPVINRAGEAYWHWFINLTKQPQNIPKGLHFPKNWVQGVTVNQKSDLWRINELRKVQVETRMISFEPIYEDLGNVNLQEIDWVILGAQTHPELIPEMPWLSNLICAAKLLEIPIFIKNNIPCFATKHYPVKFALNNRKETEVKK
jgi:protein gp37